MRLDESESRRVGITVLRTEKTEAVSSKKQKKSQVDMETSKVEERQNFLRDDNDRL